MAASNRCHFHSASHVTTLADNQYKHLQTGFLCDVTLICENDKKLRAHRNVLVSASRFFFRIYQNSQEPISAIYLQLKYEDVHSCLQFMYTGKASCASENLGSLMHAARVLGIHGLERSEESPSQRGRGKAFDPNNNPSKVNDVTWDSFINGKASPKPITYEQQSGLSVGTPLGEVDGRDYSDDERPLSDYAASVGSASDDEMPRQESGPFFPRMRQNGIDLYRCTECSFVNIDKAKVIRHYNTTHKTTNSKKRTFSCQRCSFSTLTAEKLARHCTRKHGGPGPLPRNATGNMYRCDECNFTAKYPSLIGLHKKRMHNTSLAHKCPHCPYTAAKQIGINMHVRLRHPSVLPIQPVLPIKPGTPSLALETPIPDKPATVKGPDGHGLFACSACGFLGKKKASVLQHITKRHIRESPSTPASTPTTSAVEEQPPPNLGKARVKTIKLFRCSMCAFVSRLSLAELRAHMADKHKNQLAVRPGVRFQCDECNYQTLTMWRLKKHKVRIHSRRGRRPGVNKDNAAVKPPISVVSPEAKCTVCDFVCRFRSELNAHIRSAHPDILEESAGLNDGEVEEVLEAAPAAASTPKTKSAKRLSENGSEAKARLGTTSRRRAAIPTACDECGETFPNYIRMWRHRNMVHRQELNGSFAADDSVSSSVSATMKAEETGSNTEDSQSALSMVSLDPKDAQQIFKCVECDFQTDFSRNILEHRRIAHPATDKDENLVFTCNICALKTTEVEKFLADLDTHPGQELACSLCSFRVSDISIMKEHIRNGHAILVMCALCRRIFNSLRGATFHSNRCRAKYQMAVSGGGNTTVNDGVPVAQDVQQQEVVADSDKAETVEDISNFIKETKEAVMPTAVSVEMKLNGDEKVDTKDVVEDEEMPLVDSGDTTMTTKGEEAAPVVQNGGVGGEVGVLTTSSSMETSA